MKATLVIACLIFVGQIFAGQHFDRAQELYKTGPSAAPQIINELNAELAENPANDKALLALAITQRGIGKFDESLATLERLEKLNTEKKVLNPDVFLLRVENVFYKKDYKKTQELLDGYWGIFQMSDRLKQKYRDLSEAVKKALAEEKNPKGT